MARGLNKVMIIGDVERNPEMRHTPNGRPVTSFSVATVHTWVAADGTPQEETEWFNVVAWGDLARFAHDQLEKDIRVYVEGRLKTRSWEDPQGKRHFRTEVVAREILALADDASKPLDSYYDEDYNY